MTNPRLALIGLSLLALVFGPQTSAQEARVRPLSDIAPRGAEIVDISGESAIVRLTTAIPVACAAIYGVTTAYGQIATDSDMAGGAHSDHHPVLTGLKPDTLYNLRLQGVGPDGTLYVGPNMTFRTAKASPVGAKPIGRNVALLSLGAKVRAVSSNYGGGDNNSAFGANKAIDGESASQWSSNGDGDRAWIEIDLGKDTNVASVGFFTRTMGTSAQISSFRVIADGKPFGPFAVPDAKAAYYFPLAAKARILRFEVVSSSGGNTGAAEIEVFAAP